MWRRLSVAVLGIALGIALGALSATAAGGAGTYGAGRCERAAVEHLQELGVDMNDVRDIFTTRRTRTSRGGDSRLLGIYAWVGFHSCKGSLVLHMTTRCRVTVAFTRGECRVPGVSD